MKICFFGAKAYDIEFFQAANVEHHHQITFLECHLTRWTAPLAQGHRGVCAFVNDVLDKEVLAQLRQGGTEMIAIRGAGFDNIDLPAAKELGLRIARVPEYSPHAVSEHTLALILALNRKIHRAHNRIREGNFSLVGLMGFDLYQKRVGVIGTGRIGLLVAKTMAAMGCRVVACDPFPNHALEPLGVEYVGFDDLISDCDIISLHCPLNAGTRHIIDQRAMMMMKPGVMLVNVGRGALIETKAVIEGLKSQVIGSLAIDVYEKENALFFDDLSGEIIQDDAFARLLTFPNVLITGHQAFFTREALREIANVTLRNLTELERGLPLTNEI